MDDKSKKSHTDDHHQPPSDDVTRNKIDKHLSDINDTISEDDIKNINTDTNVKPTVPDKIENKKKEEDSDEEEDPEKETPTPWEILD